MRAFAAAILPLVLGVHAAEAANYPLEMRGVWAALSGCPACPDPAEAAQRACDTYRANPKQVDGYINLFEKKKMKSFGGEGTPGEARNFSIRKLGPKRWRIAQRSYNDHGGPNHEGAWQTDVYEVSIKDGSLVSKNEHGDVSRWTRCLPQSP
jgi:hypothetical protein